MAGEPFTILCSKAPFSMDELDIPRRCGGEFERLSNGEPAPATAAQEQFVEVARGRNSPETVYERMWTKYLKKLEWESDPANRVRVEADRADVGQCRVVCMNGRTR